MKKIYVLDTNVILDNPDCLKDSFEENDLVIPLTVIEELDVIKKQSNDAGYNARQAFRVIDTIRQDQNIGNSIERNELGSTLKIVSITKEEKKEYDKLGFNLEKNDDSIILTAMKVRNDTPIETPVVLVSNDTSVRIKGSLMDIPSQFYKEGTVSKESIEYTGYSNAVLPLDYFGSEDTDGKWSSKRMPQKMALSDLEDYEIPPLYPNEFLLVSPDNKDDALCKKEIKKLKSVYRYDGEMLNKKSLTYKNIYGGITDGR